MKKDNNADKNVLGGDFLVLVLTGRASSIFETAKTEPGRFSLHLPNRFSSTE